MKRNKELQTRIFEEYSRFGKTFASPQRLKILSLLAHGPHCVEDISAHLNQSMAACSAHLQAMRQGGMVESVREGRRILYSLKSRELAYLWLMFREAAQSVLPVVREWQGELVMEDSFIYAGGPEEFFQKKASGLLLDLRPEGEFTHAHLPGARSLPFENLSGAGKPPEEQSYLYCRGPYCLRAIEGVRILRKSGWMVSRLLFSLPEWTRAGLPVEKNHD